MVKGVNKSVIEINQTGSKYFSKIILYVSPGFNEKSASKLAEEAEKIVKELSTVSYKPLRERVRKSKIKRIAFAVAASVLLSIAVTVFVFVL